MKWTLVYFDDQPQNIDSLRELVSDKFQVIGCQDALDYENVLRNHKPQIILLDVHMPGLDGYALYAHLTQSTFYNGCPVMFISGDQSDENKFRSHEYGGIDFLSREIPPLELEVRLLNKVKLYQQSSTLLEIGNLNLDLNELTLQIDGILVDVTLLEMRFLSALARRFPETMTRAELINKVWGRESVKPGTINTHITNLRPKVEAWDHTIKVREENVLILPKS